MSRLLNSRSMRVTTREASTEQLDRIESNLLTAIKERRDEIEASKKAEVDKMAKLDCYRDMLIKDGITLEELGSILTIQSSKKREPRPPKYIYTRSDGAIKTWTGQGRTPSPIADAIKGGATLENFAI